MKPPIEQSTMNPQHNENCNEEEYNECEGKIFCIILFHILYEGLITVKHKYTEKECYNFYLQT